MSTGYVQVPACPECGKDDFKDMRGYGSHRSQKHGVPGSSPSTIATRKSKQKKAKESKAADSHKYTPTGRLKKEFKQKAVAQHNKNNNTTNGNNGPITQQGEEEIVLQNHISYAFGHTQAWLQHYATSVGLSESALTGRVAELLQHASRRTVLGSRNQVSTLRPKAA